MPEQIATIVGGIADGCVQAGCALVGGETAEHPGHFGADEFDIAGAATGVVDAERCSGPSGCRPGDVVIALASSGLHSNGFSLVDAILAAAEPGLTLDRRPADLSGTLGDELLTPTRIYARTAWPWRPTPRYTRSPTSPEAAWPPTWRGCCRPTADAVLDRATWTPPAVFGLLAAAGKVPGEEMDQVFNQGVGMVAVVAAPDADRAVRLLTDRGVPCWVAGEITAGSGTVSLRGRHPA